MLNWASPWAALFLLPVACAAWRLLRRRRRAGIPFPVVSRLPRISGGWRLFLAQTAPYLTVLGLFFLVIAAMRPRTPVHHGLRAADAIAMMMTLDVSGSMEALDLTPKGVEPSEETTRLAVVKKLFTEFIDKRPDDLIGLVTFGGYASTRVPLTADHRALTRLIRDVTTPVIVYDDMGRAINGDESMTAIGDGLSVALLRLKDAEPKTKIVILLSDGVSNFGVVQPEAATQAAQEMGVRVYTIGVGTRSRAVPFFGRDFFGRKIIQTADTSFDEKQLKTIAQETKGRYFSVNDRDGLEEALDEIDRLEKTRLETETWEQWNEHYRGFVLAGLLLILVGVLGSLTISSRI